MSIYGDNDPKESGKPEAPKKPYVDPYAFARTFRDTAKINRFCQFCHAGLMPYETACTSCGC